MLYPDDTAVILSHGKRDDRGGLIGDDDERAAQAATGLGFGGGTGHVERLGSERREVRGEGAVFPVGADDVDGAGAVLDELPQVDAFPGRRAGGGGYAVVVKPCEGLR